MANYRYRTYVCPECGRRVLRSVLDTSCPRLVCDHMTHMVHMEQMNQIELRVGDIQCDDELEEQPDTSNNDVKVRFDRHLGQCRQCRENPMNLCQIGKLILFQVND